MSPRRPALAAVPGLLLAAQLGMAAAPLTAEQRQWLVRQGPVRMAPEADYGPFIYVDDQGRVQGLSADMLQLVQRHTGLQVQMVPPRPLADNLRAAQERRVDLLSSLRPTPERAAYLEFSAPYISVPAIVVTRTATTDGDGTAALRRLVGRRVTVGQGYAVEAVMRERHPQVLWQSVPDDVVALRQVAEGRADAAVADAASVAFVVRHHGLSGLYSQGRVGFEYTLTFAVRKDWPQLRAIIDEGIRAITPQERQMLLDRWAPDLERAQREPRRGRLVMAGATLLVVAALALLWLRRRRRTQPTQA